MKTKPKRTTPTVSPTQLSKRALEKLGAIVAIVEKLNPWAGPPGQRCRACGKNRIGVKQDLFGVFDLLAILGPNTLAIQTTSGTGKTGGGNHAARITKIKAEPRVLACLKAGWIVEVWSWQQPGGKGSKWECRKAEITLVDFTPELIEVKEPA